MSCLIDGRFERGEIIGAVLVKRELIAAEILNHAAESKMGAFSSYARDRVAESAA